MRSTPRHTFTSPKLIADSRLPLHPLLLLARQILRSIRKLESSDALLHILEDAHLYHVLNARTQNHHLNPLPLGRAEGRLATLGRHLFRKFGCIADQHVLAPGLHCVKGVGLSIDSSVPEQA
jgi:hypothetical protein